MTGGCSRLPLAGADVWLHRAWLTTEVANWLFADLRAQLPFSQHLVRLFGREIPSPRLSAWIGDADAAYGYSGVRHEPLAWTPSLLLLRARLREELRCDFNGVLANLYRSGADSMGWHADDEPELGPEPLIASVSLGATRRFRIKSRKADGAALAVDLAHGDLLLMGGRTQELYLHALPRTRAPVGERINLTFRRIQPAFRSWTRPRVRLGGRLARREETQGLPLQRRATQPGGLPGVLSGA